MCARPTHATPRNTIARCAGCSSTRTRTAWYPWPACMPLLPRRRCMRSLASHGAGSCLQIRLPKAHRAQAGETCSSAQCTMAMVAAAPPRRQHVGCTTICRKRLACVQLLVRQGGVELTGFVRVRTRLHPPTNYRTSSLWPVSHPCTHPNSHRSPTYSPHCNKHLAPHAYPQRLSGLQTLTMVGTRVRMNGCSSSGASCSTRWMPRSWHSHASQGKLTARQHWSAYTLVQRSC